jgi:hypothetical protein
MILLLTKAIGAIFDNIGAVAHSTMVGNSFLDHAGYFTITYFSPTTQL